MTSSEERPIRGHADALDLRLAARAGVALAALESQPVAKPTVPEPAAGNGTTHVPSPAPDLVAPFDHVVEREDEPPAIADHPPAAEPEPSPPVAPVPVGQSSALVTPRRASLVKRTFWYPLLRWLDRRIRRAIDQSHLATTTADGFRRMEVAFEAMARLLDGIAGAGTRLDDKIVQLHQQHDEKLAGHRFVLDHLYLSVESARSGHADAIRRVELLTEGLGTVVAASDVKNRDAALLEEARSDSLHLAIGELLSHDAHGLAALSGQLKRVAALQDEGAVATARLGNAVAESGASTSRLLDNAAQQSQSSRKSVELLRRINQRAGTQGEQIAATLDHVERLVQRNYLVLDDAIAIRSDAGYLLSPKYDVSLALSLIENRGCLEPGTRAVIASLLRNGDRAVDVGANVGTLTLPMARAVGPTGHVLAIEPTPEVAALLRRTVALNGLADRVVVEKVAASDRSGVLRFETSTLTTHNRHAREAVSSSADVSEVPARPLDDLLPDHRNISLVKIDVEGDELLVWRGMRRIAAANAGLAVILEFAPSHLFASGVTIDDWVAELQQDDFRLWEICEQTSSISTLRTKGLDQVYSLNVMLMRSAPPPELLHRGRAG